MAATPVREIRPAVTEEPPVASRRRASILPWVLVAVAVAGAAAFAVLWQGAEAEQRAENELRDRARAFVLALTNFSSDSIQADVEEIRSFATGRFAEEVDTLFGEQTIAADRRGRGSEPFGGAGAVRAIDGLRERLGIRGRERRDNEPIANTEALSEPIDC